MQIATKRELNQQTASVLAMATETDDVIITEHGHPRWRLTAIAEFEDALDDLRRSGRYTPPVDDPTPWPTTGGAATYSLEQVDTLLAEMRGER